MKAIQIVETLTEIGKSKSGWQARLTVTHKPTGINEVFLSPLFETESQARSSLIEVTAITNKWIRSMGLKTKEDIFN